MSDKPKPGQGDADLAASLEEEADRINEEVQPDWEEIGNVRAEASDMAKARKLTDADHEAFLERVREAVPANRPELVKGFAAFLRGL